METNVEMLQALRNWYRLVRKEYGEGFGERVGLGELIFELDFEVAKGLQGLHRDGLDENLKAMMTWLESRNYFPEFLSPDSVIVGENGGLARTIQTLDSVLNQSETVLKDMGLEINEIMSSRESLISHNDTLKQFQNDRIIEDLGIDISDFDLKMSNNDPKIKAFIHTLEMAKILIHELDVQQITRAVMENPNRSTIENIIGLGVKIDNKANEYVQTLKLFTSIGGVNDEGWGIDEKTPIGSIIEKNKRALEHIDDLGNWLTINRYKKRIARHGFEKLLENVDSGVLLIQDLKNGFELGVNHVLSTEIIEEMPDLLESDGIEIDAWRARFVEVDIELKRLQNQKIASKVSKNEIPYGISGGLKRDLTELALIKNEISKKKRHAPIRQLVYRSGSALKALKPCFMMGPMSVAQYLKPGELKFDLVIMDEASQIRPEEAFGSIARAKQCIIVGDPKQLPPTSFFDRIMAEDDTDDTMAIEDSESILDAAIPLYPTRRLRWHYRSRHESLIKFSNTSFYSGDLIIFPSPHGENEQYGVKHSYISDGVFENRRNLQEAKSIVAAIKNHLFNHRDESLGVVAMNTTQRDAIEIELDSQTKFDSEFREAFNFDRQKVRESLFIKNLENVQGDERDVIIISTTYGPSKVGGRVMQRFGPLVQEVGWRRLNVLLTRAKKRMHIFTSLHSSDILVSGSKSRGVRAFREFLQYAETGEISTVVSTGKEPDSDFEIAVAEMLQLEGYDCEFQLGISGYFIDVVVKDPYAPGEYVMGIECDGRMYHSAKSARDRDRLRQSVLEGLGWEIQRIWSTDWFQNSDAAIKPILRRLEKLTFNPKKALREELLAYNESVIRPQLPNIGESEWLLRDEMVDALLRLLPTRRDEFLDLSLTLRENIHLDETDYIDAILQIISDAGLSPT